MKLRLSSLLQQFEKLRAGFGAGIQEFIRASREVQEELGIDPPSAVEYFAFFRAIAAILLLCGYVIIVTLLARAFFADL